ncbi:IS66 family insertion sequence element accessory protein TnpA [Microbulbifer epialgicus]|uniref:Uncharacterized protein n=1 Tax=Microbulbifer epialgicus TaxID=393907 RepID=A0ABV4P6L5_9GAMM
MNSQQWQCHVRAYEKSSQSKRAYTRKHNLNYSQFLLSAALAGCLEVKAKEERGYDRHEWLPKWSDTNGDCQSTRHELLVQFSLTPVTLFITKDKELTGCRIFM